MLLLCVFISVLPHFSPGSLSCPGPYPPSVRPPHLAADAVISPQITPANWDQHRDTWVQSGGSGVLEPAKQSWFDRFPLNPDEVQKNSVCVCCQACLKKATHSLGMAEWGQVCRVPAHLAGIECACVRGSAKSGWPENLGISWGFFWNIQCLQHRVDGWQQNASEITQVSSRRAVITLLCVSHVAAGGSGDKWCFAETKRTLTAVWSRVRVRQSD